MKLSQLDPHYLRELEYRYYSKVRYCEHGPECEECCFPWLAGTNRTYGTISVDGKMLLAHRVGWMLSYRSEIPDGQIIRHYCDYGLCQQPNHWQVGTQADNVADIIIAGTTTRKFSDKEAIEIRSFQAVHSWNYHSLAAKFGTNRETIRFVLNYKGAYAIKQ
jgi:hypothetical protein